jgi:two-component system phosphate regulon sensor histidine kinase PhoR
MKETILSRMVILTLIAVLISSVASVIVVYNAHLDRTSLELRADAEFIMALVEENSPVLRLMKLEALQRNDHTRLTIIAPDGRVLYDNWANASEMENHADRKEVVLALEQGEAEVGRLSATLDRHILYFALLMDDGNVVRFAKETESIPSTLYQMLSLIVLLIIGITLVAFWLGDRMANAIITPINGLNLDDPLGNDVYAELSPLLLRINSQNKGLRKHMVELQRQQERFQTITTYLAEGLILLDHSARIVYMNSSAHSILGSPGSEISEFIGRSLLTFNRDPELRRSVEQGLGGYTDQSMLTIGGKHYELLVSPIAGEHEKTQGVIIILVDVTEKQESERMRKEFSANVSHELRTPLTAISSLAEVLKNDLVSPADVPEFAGRIHDEAQRLSKLVDDILKLSRLDERVDMAEKEKVDLYHLIKEVKARLEPLAVAKNVEFVLAGQSAEVMGDPGILFEMIYNLCDNAIKYSGEDGGKVEVSCLREGDKVVLKVADNGQGIPAQHHERIFERFYRVDKSHSRATGGTGLGLAIVKHAAAYHGASIHLQSQEGVGTTITLEF